MYFSSNSPEVLSLNENARVINAANVTSFEAEGLANITTYYWRVISRNSANNLALNGPVWSFTTETDPNLTSVVVGDGTTSDFKFPWNFFYSNSVAETIYLADELAISGSLQGISYYNNFVSNIIDTPVNIWVGETSQTDLSTYIPASDLTAVFSGTVDFPVGENSINITFDTPYTYGGGNLVVLTEREYDTNYYSSSDKFYNTETELEHRTIFWQDDYDDLDPNVLADGEYSNRMANLTLYFLVEGMGTVTGTITDGTAGLAGVNLAIEDTNYRTITATDGSFIFPYVPEAEDYTLTASKLGYYEVATTFDVVVDQETVVDLALEMLPNVIVSGQVITNDTGLGIQAHVVLTGYQTYETDTDDDGYFTIPGVFTNEIYSGTAIAYGYQTGYFEAVVGTTDLNLGTVLVTETLFSANNVVASLDGSDAIISWDAPDGLWITKGGDENFDGVGTGNPLILHVAHKYTEAELVDYQGLYINSIKFFPNEASATYTLKIWGGADGNTELYSQAVINFTNAEWNEFALNSSVAIPATCPVFIGYYVDTPGGWAAGCDAGHNVPGGDMVKLNNAPDWSALTNLDMNWNIKAYVSPNSRDQVASASRRLLQELNPTGNQEVELSLGNLTPRSTITTNNSRELESYNVYRFLLEDEANEDNWILIDEEITATTTTDTDWASLEVGFYKYAVQAVYTSGVEAEASLSNWLQKVDVVDLTFNVDSNLGAAIADARISLTSQAANPDGGYDHYETVTDASGSATVTVNVGNYNLLVVSNGFLAHTAELDATSDLVVDVTLNEAALPPTAIIAELDGSNALVTWGTPGGDGAGEWISKGSETNADGMGSGLQSTMHIAHKYTEAELADYQGMYINAIKFFPKEHTATYTLKVWGGAHGNSELYSQPVTEFINNSWNEYTLNLSVPIPINGPVYIGYFIDTPTGFPAGCDAGPNVEGGDMAKLNNQAEWSSISSSPNIDLNWNIQSYVSWSRGADVAVESRVLLSKSNPTATTNAHIVQGNLEPIPSHRTIPTRDLLGYKVWRLLVADHGNQANWSSLTNEMITDLTYSDSSWDTLPSGAYQYAVKAIYTDNNTSPAGFSNELLKGMHGTVDGTVMSEGTPLIGANVSLAENSVTTDASGYFIFTEVLSGDYSITASAPNYVTSTQNITLVGNEFVTVNFDLAPSSVIISDSFETYPDFALEADPWTMVDGDLSSTYGLEGYDFLNANMAMAYMVFNPTMTNPPLTDIALVAHTGSKYMASFAATSPDNNDWLITEEFMLGDSGTFSFWAKTFQDHGLERFNVLISNGSINPDDFTSISGTTYTEAPLTWTQFAYSLDAYADQTIRVAIRCVSSDAFIFMVDDVEIDAPGGTDIENNETVAVSQLAGNYPNPFNPETTISFSTKENGPVSINIYNIKGQKVRSLLNENREAGSYSVVWNGRDDNGKAVSSGVFFYRMNSGKYSSTKKMILMK